MKTILLSIFALCFIHVSGQLDNRNYNDARNSSINGYEININGDAHNMTISTEVIYNAIPDGYQITYTTSFIANSVEKTEELLSRKSDSIAKAVSEIGLSRKDVIFDVIALDPIFDFQRTDSIAPIGYKVTENIVFNVTDFSRIPRLAEICLKHGIYDLINAQAYLNDSKPVYEKMNDKLVELVNQKKKLCKDLGANIDNAKVKITRHSDTYYPSERYLKSLIQNPSFYKHHLSQNSTLSLNRAVDVDNYFDYNLKQVDFVFNPNNTQPVIQFYYKLVTEYVTPDTEEEIRKKVEEELKAKEKSKTKAIYTIDEKGNLNKIEL
ncbi:hypothetical protein [Fluviicola sp.]|uniref:hypothetical protein n=1 Tax=Fluviicola sp. TaxID=1917219 RepID=UPI0026154F37|nr:hypothetical protein [Fluviicola sp.]